MAVMSCSSCKNFVFLGSVHRLLVTANVVPSSPILVTLMIEALSSSETSVLTRAKRRNISEDGILLIRISSLVSYDPIADLISIYICAITVFYIYCKCCIPTEVYMGFHADLLSL
jgi:hypothetical protein